MGSIEGNKFTIERMIGYRGGYAPIISGEVIEVNGGSKINVTMFIEKVYIILWTLVFLAGVLFLGFLGLNGRSSLRLRAPNFSEINAYGCGF